MSAFAVSSQLSSAPEQPDSHRTCDADGEAVRRMRDPCGTSALALQIALHEVP